MALLQGNRDDRVDTVGGINPSPEGRIGINLDHEGCELGFRHGDARLGTPHP